MPNFYQVLGARRTLGDCGSWWALVAQAGLEAGAQDREELKRQQPSLFPHPPGLGGHPGRNLIPCTRPSNGNAW